METMQTGNPRGAGVETVELTPDSIREAIDVQYLTGLERAEGGLNKAITWGELHPRLDPVVVVELRGALDVLVKARQAVTADSVPQFEGRDA